MIVNALLVLWHGGWRERINYPVISEGVRVEGLLGLGSIQSKEEADRIADAQLAIFSTPQVEITIGTDPISEDDAPYLAYRVGDIITVEGVEERVVAISITEDENGVLTFVPQLRGLLADDQERLNRTVKKMANGTLGGSSNVPTPATLINIPTSTTNCCPPEPAEGGGG